MSLNIHISTMPPHLRITETMICDFICNPVLGAEVIMGLKLDAFQRVRLKICWGTPRVMDSSGVSSAKTIGAWIATNLRALLLPGHVVGVYYPAFESAKNIFGPYFTKIAAMSPLYRAQLGRQRVLGVDGKEEAQAKAMHKGPSCWVVSYKNGSEIMVPAPGFLQDAKTSAGYRFNDLFIDEFTKVAAMGSSGIDDQLIGRTTKETFNKLHPIYRNHHLFSATAEDTMHPAYSRYKTFLDQVKLGNPDYAIISFNYKDYSNLTYVPGSSFKDKLREDQAMKDMKLNKSRSGYLQEALGIWSRNGRGLYTTEMIELCNALGASKAADIFCSRKEDPQGDRARYFLGVDPAKADTKKADDGALVALRAIPMVSENNTDPRTFDLSFCYAYKVRGANVDQWSALVHRKHIHFQFTGICMDSGGGGIWIEPKLKDENQIIRGVPMKVRPIATVEDEEGMMVAADFIMSMFRPRDTRVSQCWPNVNNMRSENLVDFAHQEFIEALRMGIAIPPPMSKLEAEKTKNWNEEKRWASELVSGVKAGIGAQLMQICVQTNDDGSTFYTKGVLPARVFSSKVKKDFAYAALMAYCRFLMWVRGASSDLIVDEENAAMCGAS